MKSDEIRHSAAQHLLQLLNPVRHVSDLSVFLCEAEPVEALHEREVSLVNGGVMVPWLVAEAVVKSLQSLGIQMEFSFDVDDADNARHIKLKLQNTKQHLPAYKFTAPWYVELYCKSPDIDPTAKRTLQSLLQILNTEQGGSDIFRG